MLGLESLSGTALAAALIGLVLLEAIVLYVGYGALESVAGKYVVDFIRGD
ncbi:hypothetical protein SAMN06269185_0359 [Natronoarchaeum philippinense]|uniref:Uncharacterized protein n=1 Tax=Natronoarchaeum philippinense TaxID=558529 RepID=A0A285N2Q7_NATPI|nr:hypothetical protein [Natronoarchaeum philippinense]SNZ03745.1 hypothetical protein SAMN06269185_0359 [Natronoarchaeum philippinense]